MFLREFFDMCYRGLRDNTLVLEDASDEELSVVEFRHLYEEIINSDVKVDNSLVNYLLLQVDLIEAENDLRWYDVYAVTKPKTIKFDVSALTWEQWLGLPVTPVTASLGLAAACAITRSMTEFGNTYKEHTKEVKAYAGTI